MTELTQLIHEELTSEQLNDRIHQIGREKSAIDCCETFCTPPGIKTLLAPVLEGTDRRIGHYSRSPKDTMEALILQGKAARPEDYHSLVQQVSRALPGQLVIIPARLLPDNERKFLKRGTTLPVRHKGQKITIDKALEEAIRTVTTGQSFSGYDFQGNNYTNKDYKLIALVDVIRGHIYDKALTTAINVKFYEGDKPLQTGVRAGITQIPSFHNNNKEYMIGLSGVPVYRGTRRDTTASNGFDVNQLSDSPREMWDVVKFKRDMPVRDADRTGHEQRWDHHTILAYLRLERKLQEADWHVVKPFITPSPKTVQFYWKMLNNCLVENAGEKYELNPLTIQQAEYLLWKRIGYVNEASQRRTG